MQNLGLISIMATWISTAWLIGRVGLHKNKTISQHAAIDDKATWKFTIVEVLIALNFFVFIVLWFVPEFMMPTIFTFITGLGLAGLIIAALIPHTTGTRAIIHSIGAYSMAASMLVTMPFLIYSDQIPYSLVLSLIAVLILAITIFGAFNHKKYEKRVLYFQSGYIALYQAAIILVTYS